MKARTTSDMLPNNNTNNTGNVQKQLQYKQNEIHTD